MRKLLHALLASLSLAALPVVTHAGVFVGVSVNIAPPALPVYVQPPPPAAGYLWIPGYWAWADGGYYWVPGTWELAPAVGLLWTPGYWGWGGGAYVWYPGYWGPHVGFYGGINYGFGYTGVGYAGGYWRGNDFYYNRAVTNVSNTNITNIYNRTVVNNVTTTRVSFNGGAGGVVARPSAAEQRAAGERHVAATPAQREHEQKAQAEPALRAAANGGRPAIAATQRAAMFSGHGVVAAHGASPATHAPAYAMNRGDRPPQAQRAGEVRGAGVHADRPPQAQRAGEVRGAGVHADRPPQPHAVTGAAHPAPHPAYPQARGPATAQPGPPHPTYPQARGPATAQPAPPHQASGHEHAPAQHPAQRPEHGQQEHAR
jgi:WXXGXW repeat (2 copies)